ncbi:hypothetical protein DDE20_17635 [Pararhodobacter oceanensis]|uniref:Uncharacterized protein n=1 Tax=Pararhodobacter oceanensis TaxID=2172121 RepID=A0A2T8HQ81_9RHOB|nr:hypothetical protein DDE20_17635 [Pararhodobacter oceanensis]
MADCDGKLKTMVAALAGGTRQAVVALIAIDRQGAVKALQDPFCVFTGEASGVGGGHAVRNGTAPSSITTGLVLRRHVAGFYSAVDAGPVFRGQSTGGAGSISW